EHNLMAVRGATDNIAHDLRTPLSHIRIGLEELATKPAADIGEGCAILTEELDHCLATFDAMLSLTRIEEGQQALDLQELSLAQLCTDLADMAEAVAESNGQTLRLSLLSDWRVHGDKYLLFQALYNLVDNAMKYSGPGARIDIIQSGAQIRICDNGPGIPDDSKERVFERLVRLDPSRHLQGTGLGLSMVKAILSRHNARISLSDNLSGEQRGGLVVTIDF
ncbi:MAG: sensor histidine kinase, partial [Shewanella sp.]